MERILLLPGDGIGPEVTREAQRALDAAARRAGLKLGFEEDLIGGASIDAHGTPLSDLTLARARESRAVLMGAVGGPKWDALPVERRAERGLLRLRKELGLFANLRPAAVMPALVGASTLRPTIAGSVIVGPALRESIQSGGPRLLDVSVADGFGA